MSEKIDPELDGVGHINIYSSAKTSLGRLLSNFARTPFFHPEYGYFASMEGFYYWASTGKMHDELKPLYGYLAKKKGKEFPVVKYRKFQEDVTRAAKLKVIQNPEILELLSRNDLPFYHYYVYGGTHVVDRTEQSRWLINAIEQASDNLQSLY